MNDEEIGNLEIAVRDRYKDNPSTTDRALDGEYLSMLEKLKKAYCQRNSPMIRDNFGWNASDSKRIKMLDEVQRKLAEEFSALLDMARE